MKIIDVKYKYVFISNFSAFSSVISYFMGTHLDDFSIHCRNIWVNSKLQKYNFYLVNIWEKKTFFS